MKKKKSKYILITGGAGYIGSHISHLLEKKKVKLLIIDDLSTGKKSFIPKKTKFIKIDLLNKKRLKNKLKNYDIDSIVHLASYINVSESELNPKKYIVDTLMMTNNILEIAATKKIKNFIFSSSAAVYGKQNKVKLKETDRANPQSNYGLGKYFCEQIVKKYCEKNKINYSILRYFNVIGSDYNNKIGPLNEGSLFRNIASNIARKKYEVIVYGRSFNTFDGSALRDFIDVEDLSFIHYSILKYINKTKSLIINCGYAKPYSVLEIIKKFSKISKKKLRIKFKKKRIGEIEKIYADNSRLLKLFPEIKRKNNINQSILNCIKWEKYLLKKNQNNFD
jgi:UDP-glucose 4-epimerase